MCVEANVVAEAFKYLFTSPTQFFTKDKDNYWNKPTLATIFFGAFIVAFLLNVVQETLNYGAVGPFHDVFLQLLGLNLMSWANSWALILGTPVILFAFLWGTSKVVKASLSWQQSVILCLFFTIPSFLTMNLILPFVVLIVNDELTRMVMSTGMLLVMIVWSLTVMILGVQAYSGASWFRAFSAALPVAVLMFLSASQAVVMTVFALMGLTQVSEPPADVMSF